MYDHYYSEFEYNKIKLKYIEEIFKIESKIFNFEKMLDELGEVHNDILINYDKHQFSENDICSRIVKDVISLYEKITQFIVQTKISIRMHDQYSEDFENSFFNIRKNFVFCRYIMNWIYELCIDSDNVNQKNKRKIKVRFDNIGKSKWFKHMKNYRDSILHNSRTLVDIFYNGLLTPFNEVNNIIFWLNKITKFVLFCFNESNYKLWA